MKGVSLDTLYERADAIREARKRAEAAGPRMRADVERLAAEYRTVIDEITRRNVARKRRERA